MRRELVKFALCFVVVALVMGSVATYVLVNPASPAARRGPTVTAAPGRLETDVRWLAHPRPHDDIPSLDGAAAWIRDRLIVLGLKPEEQVFKVSGDRYANIHAVIGDPALPRIIIGAHYDTCDALPGADDNASGVAVVLELARLFMEQAPGGAAIELVFWTLEEPPYFGTTHMGSMHHAAAADPAKTIAVLSVETVGYYDDAEGSQQYPVSLFRALYSSSGNFVALVSNTGGENRKLVREVKAAMLATGGIPVHSTNAPAIIPGIDWSDHASYWGRGIPALMITDTALNRNTRYHTANDTPQTLDYVRMARVTEALFEATWSLAVSRGGAQRNGS